MNVVSVKLERDGNLGDALKVLSRARQIAPTDMGVLNALGLILVRLERPVEALEAFDTALSLDKDLPFLHASRGLALQMVGRLDWAEAAHRRALELWPDHPIALAGLASIASQKGDHATARELAEKVLVQHPGYPDAELTLAKAELAAKDPAAAEARMRGQLADPRLTPLEVANAQSALGDALDAQGRPAEAFAAYEACNTALKSLYEPRFGGDGARAFTQGMTRWFGQGPAWPATPGRAPRANEPRRHVFLVGFPRSGTTLLEVALAGHPDVATLEEQDALAPAARAFMANPALDRLTQATDGELEDLRHTYFDLCRQAGAEVAGKVFLDRFPMNTLKLPLIARLFPDAVILFAERDPRDVVLSCFRRRFAMSAPMYEFLTLEGAARFYDAVMTFADKVRPTLGQTLHTVRHEALVADFEGEMRKICAAVDLEFTPQMADFGARTATRAIATPSTAQLTGGLSSEGVGAWRRYEDQLKPVLPLLAPWVEKMGYSA
jgi:Flp pilus assembly protein TadD